jgi:hypothetical protein
LVWQTSWDQLGMVVADAHRTVILANGAVDDVVAHVNESGV